METSITIDNASVRIIATGVTIEKCICENNRHGRHARKYFCENNRNRRHNRKIHLWEAFVRTRETKTMINPCCPLTTIICPWVPLLESLYSLYVLFVQQQAKYSMLKYLRVGTQKQVHFCTKNWLTKVCSPPVGWYSLGCGSLAAVKLRVPKIGTTDSVFMRFRLLAGGPNLGP